MVSVLILYALAFGQVLLLFGIAGPQAIRLGERAFLNRNPAWVEANGAPPATDGLRRLFMMLSAGVGVGQLAALFLLAAQPVSWSAPVVMLIAPLPGLAVVIGAYIWRGYRGIYQHIPAPATRSSSLKPRRVWHFVNGWAAGLAMLMALAFALNYVRAFREALVPAHLLIARGAVFVLAAAVVVTAIVQAVRRREVFVAAQGGEAARRLEIGLYVVVLYALIAAHQYLVMADIANMAFPPAFVLLIAGVGAMQVYGLYACLWAGRTAGDRRRWRLVLRTVVIYAVGVALSCGLARVALEPVYAREAHLADTVAADVLNDPDVRSWSFGETAGKPGLKRQLHRDATVPGGAYWHVDVPYKGHERWDTLVRARHVRAIRRGDVVEAQVWLRSDQPGGAQIDGLTQSTLWGWTPIGKATWQVGPVWTLYRVRGVATKDYAAGESDFELHLASGAYAFDLGQARVHNLGPERRGEGQ